LTSRGDFLELLIYNNVSLPFLQLGGWGAYLYPITPFSERWVARFQESLAPFFRSPSILNKDHSYLVISSHPIPNKPKYLNGLNESRQKHTWGEFHKACMAAYNHYCRICSHLSGQGKAFPKWFTYSWPELNHGNSDIWVTSLDQALSPYISCLVINDSADEGEIAIWKKCLSLATRWNIKNGGLCLHSSAVDHGKGGFLFLGDSETGKSTIAKLSHSVGFTILGDDLNFVVYDKEYHLTAGPSIQALSDGYSDVQPPLRSVFTLVQDTCEYLIPLPPRRLAKALFESLMQTPSGSKLPNEAIYLAYQTIGDIARRIPGYELHFRKSPDFWQLIDAEFPD
jgi:hypothetical protein